MRTHFANKKLVLAGSFAALVLGVGATTAYAQYAAPPNYPAWESPPIFRPNSCKRPTPPTPPNAPNW